MNARKLNMWRHPFSVERGTPYLTATEKGTVVRLAGVPRGGESYGQPDPVSPHGDAASSERATPARSAPPDAARVRNVTADFRAAAEKGHQAAEELLLAALSRDPDTAIRRVADLMASPHATVAACFALADLFSKAVQESGCSGAAFTKSGGLDGDEDWAKRFLQARMSGDAGQARTVFLEIEKVDLVRVAQRVIALVNWAATAMLASVKGGQAWEKTNASLN